MRIEYSLEKHLAAGRRGGQEGEGLGAKVGMGGLKLAGGFARRGGRYTSIRGCSEGWANCSKGVKRRDDS